MKATAQTRKPVEALDASDLEASPVWEFVADDGSAEDEDETWVKPVQTPEIPVAAFSLCVAVVARLASGAVYPAVAFGDSADTLMVNALALLTTEGRVLFTNADSASETRRALKRLGLDKGDVFPIEFATRVPLAGTPSVAFGIFPIEQATRA